MAVITGMGAVSALGRGVDAIWRAMAEGRDGIREIRRFSTESVGIGVAGMVPDCNEADDPRLPWQVCVELGISAAREAWQQAGLDAVPRDRIAFVFGSSIGDRTVGIDVITESIANALGIAGPRIAVSTACTSSTNSIGLGLDLLSRGVADAVIAGGSDALSPLVVAGFTALGVLTPGKCAPFSEPVGTTLGEGAGFLVLQREGQAAFALRGYGLSADAFHDTSPDPTGGGVARAMRAALRHATVAPDEIDYINAHGTGTAQNDPAEWRAIQQVFGARAETLPVSASKSFLGHAQGAAGVLETIATLVAMEHGTIPPTQHFTVPRPKGPRDPVGQQTARPARCDVAISTSSAFGGANCALVVARSPGTSRTERRTVALTGISAIGPHGVGLAHLAERVRGRVPKFSFRDVVPTADPRGLDPCTRYLLAAIELGLADAGVRIKGDARDRSGLVLGVTMQSPESDDALHRTIAERGHRGISAPLFARQVLNAPAGTAAKTFGLRASHSTVCAGAATGLVAMAYAAELVATQLDCDRVLAVGVDEIAATDPVDARSEGAACALFTPGPGAIELAGWSLAGPGHVADAVRRAMEQAGDPSIDLVIGRGGDLDIDELVGTSPAFGSALAVVLATVQVRAGRARTVLIRHTGGTAADCAMVITRGDSRAS